jgi:hypothetical protein
VRFLERYLALGWVCGFRYAVPLLFLVGVAVNFLARFVDESDHRFIFIRLSMFGVGVVTYAVIGKHMRDVAAGSV